MNVHPYIIFCGKLNAISKAFVILNGENYEFKNPLEAVDVCFKVSIALHCWLETSTVIWNYLQQHVYGILPDISCAFPLSKSLKTISTFIKKVDASLIQKGIFCCN